MAYEVTNGKLNDNTIKDLKRHGSGNMKVLYVSYDNPAIDTILAGMDEDKLWGLPALYFPFKMLLEKGAEIDLLLFSPDSDKTIIESEHFKKDNLILKQIKRNAIFNLFYVTGQTKKQLKTKKYDFVYGMGEGTHMAVRTAAKMGVPCALRQFGTQEMANVLETKPKGISRWIKALKDYTYITLSMISRKSFVLATNDGSRADELYDILGIKKKKFDFYFWRSAVTIPKKRPEVDIDAHGNYPEGYDPLCLSMVGRISEVKRQDRAAKILGELHKRGYPFHLYLIGYPTGNYMLDETMKVAEEYGVKDYIHITGGQPQSVCRKYARNSLATLLVSEWNRVNIFYEVMGEGSVVVTNNNHSIDEFIDDDENCIVYDTEAEAAERLVALMNDKPKIEKLRRNAYNTATEKFMTLERRFGMEAQLVIDTAAGKDTSNYKTVI